MVALEADLALICMWHGREDSLACWRIYGGYASRKRWLVVFLFVILVVWDPFDCWYALRLLIGAAIDLSADGFRDSRSFVLARFGGCRSGGSGARIQRTDAADSGVGTERSFDRMAPQARVGFARLGSPH